MLSHITLQDDYNLDAMYKTNIVLLLIPVSADPCIMINTTESVLRPSPKSTVLSSPSFVWMKKSTMYILLPRAVRLSTRNNKNTHNEMLYKYIYIYSFFLGQFSTEHTLAVQKTQLLRTVEKCISLPNENWFNSQQIFCT